MYEGLDGLGSLGSEYVNLFAMLFSDGSQSEPQFRLGRLGT
jgi:hypothetical protein